MEDPSRDEAVYGLLFHSSRTRTFEEEIAKRFFHDSNHERSTSPTSPVGTIGTKPWFRLLGGILFHGSGWKGHERDVKEYIRMLLHFPSLLRPFPILCSFPTKTIDPSCPFYHSGRSSIRWIQTIIVHGLKLVPGSSERTLRILPKIQREDSRQEGIDPIPILPLSYPCCSFDKIQIFLFRVRSLIPLGKIVGEGIVIPEEQPTTNGISIPSFPAILRNQEGNAEGIRGLSTIQSDPVRNVRIEVLEHAFAAELQPR